jgi:single-strand selective monofunctional uracil DNA glycosylase
MASPHPAPAEMSAAETFWWIESNLAAELLKINYGPKVHYIYNPLDYACKPHQDFLNKYCHGREQGVLFLGMNPGPFGMAQTGVS